MPALSNVRQELFCQAVAEGSPPLKAYVKAGYAPNNGNAYQLAKRKKVATRINELEDQKRAITAVALQKAADKAGVAAVDRAWVLAKLVENANKAMQAEPVLDSKGNETGEFTYQAAAANRALELVGKELGMFIERREIKEVDEFDKMTDEELRAAARTKLAELEEASKQAAAKRERAGKTEH